MVGAVGLVGADAQPEAVCRAARSAYRQRRERAASGRGGRRDSERGSAAPAAAGRAGSRGAPVAAKPRSISLAAPSPTMCRDMRPAPRPRRPCSARTAFRQRWRSGAVSNSVPSRSKTRALRAGGHGRWRRRLHGGLPCPAASPDRSTADADLPHIGHGGNRLLVSCGAMALCRPIRSSPTVSPAPMTENRAAAIVLAAGKGIRMKSDLPKVMHRIAGRPMIDHLLANLAPLGCEPVAVVIGPGMESVAKAVAPHKTALQSEQRGTGPCGALRAAALQGFTGDVLISGRRLPVHHHGDDPAAAGAAARRGQAGGGGAGLPARRSRAIWPADPSGRRPARGDRGVCATRRRRSGPIAPVQFRRHGDRRAGAVRAARPGRQRQRRRGNSISRISWPSRAPMAPPAPSWRRRRTSCSASTAAPSWRWPKR